MMGLRRIWDVYGDDVATPEEILHRVCYLIAQARDSAGPNDIVAQNICLELLIRLASSLVLPLTINASYWLMMLASFVLSIPGWLSTVKPASERILTPSPSIGSEISTLKAHIQPLETVVDVFASGGLSFLNSP